MLPSCEELVARGIPVTHRDHACELCGVDLLSERAILCRRRRIELREDTMRDVEPHARELGCDRELEGVRRILSRGPSADGQLRIFNANRDIVEVVHAIADATEAAAVPAVA